MNIEDLLKHPEKARTFLDKAIFGGNKKLAEILIPIVKHPYSTYLYAKEIVKGKIKDEWEYIIAQDPYASLDYAFNILKGPFPKGEDAIARDSYTSYNYAVILERPWPKGEDVIARDPRFAYYYARYVLKDRFPKGEKEIISSEITDPGNDFGENGESGFSSYVKFLKSINKLDEFLKDHPEVKDRV